jgi:hypothetical protein
MKKFLPLLAALLVLAGCTAGATTATHHVAGRRASSTPATRAPAVAEYVALGDSYTAAPYVPLTDVALGCLRSDHNYPHLLARTLHVTRFHDVSCSAARVHDLTAAQPTFHGQSVPPQLAALSTRTALVTLGIGGNDDGLFAALVGGCPVSTPMGTSPGRPGQCGKVDTAAARAAIRDIGSRVRGALAAIHHRAPHARVVLVGYPRIASTTTTCPAIIPVAHADALVLDRTTRLLDRTLAATARAGHAAYVDVYRASAGHDACANVPWVNGIHTDTRRAAALHPFAAEQRAVARLIARQIARQISGKVAR